MTTRADSRTPRARRLRHDATPQERKLWARLRQIAWPGGGHFRRQAPIGPYFADFVHHGLKLIVELDGGQHASDEGVRRDAERTARLERAGYAVIRFWNAEVADNFDGVIDTILARSAALPPTPVRAPRDSALPTASGGRVGASLAAMFLAATVAYSLPTHAAEQRAVGSWTLKWGQGAIGAYCTVESVQQGRTLGLQVIKTGKIFFGFRDPAWRFEPKSLHEAALSVAGEADWAGKAIAVLPDAVVFPIASDPGLDPARVMASGKTLTFTIGDRSVAFGLEDFPQAAAAQRSCLAEPG